MLGEVVQRHLAPTLAMLAEAIRSCPEHLLRSETVGVREHVYHALVGMDIWVDPDPSQYPFDQIVDQKASMLEGPACDRITRDFLLDYVAKVDKKVAALCSQSADLLSMQTIRGKALTGLDRCLSQLRHPQHHMGAVNEILRADGSPVVEWRGYGE